MALISENELREKIKKRSSGVYVVFGEEDYLKSSAVSDLRKMALSKCDESLREFNRTVITYENYTPESINQAAASVPFMSDMRVIEAELRLSSMKESEWRGFLDALKASSEYTSAVTVIKCLSDSFDFGMLPKRPSQKLKELSAIADCIYFGPQPEYRLKKWLTRHFLSWGLHTDDSALDKILEICGTDMFVLRSEVDKLAAYASYNGCDYVDSSMPDKVCCVNEKDVAFELANAVSSGNKSSALKALKRCRDRKESPVAVMASVTKTMGDMLYVSSLMTDGLTKKEISEKLKIHEYRVGLYMNCVKDSRPEKLYASMLRCSETDRMLKSSSLGYEAIERFICTLAV